MNAVFLPSLRINLLEFIRFFRLVVFLGFGVFPPRGVEGLEIECIERIGWAQASSLPEKPCNHPAIRSRHSLLEESDPTFRAALLTSSH
jgi:hypothetical protein